jgi:hypothetical protein
MALQLLNRLMLRAAVAAKSLRYAGSIISGAGGGGVTPTITLSGAINLTANSIAGADLQHLLYQMSH